MKVLIRTFDYSDTLGMVFYETDHEGKRKYAKPIELEFVERKPGIRVESTLEFPNYFDQDSMAIDMMEQLQALGVKLPEKKYLEGRLEQMEKHLEDMRKLVFGDE